MDPLVDQSVSDAVHPATAGAGLAVRAGTDPADFRRLGGDPLVCGIAGLRALPGPDSRSFSGTLSIGTVRSFWRY